MKRREAAMARSEKRSEKTLRESDYLLGVFDGHRITRISAEKESLLKVSKKA